MECGGRGEARAGDAAFPQNPSAILSTISQHDAKAVSTSYARKLASGFATALQVSLLNDQAEVRRRGWGWPESLLLTFGPRCLKRYLAHERVHFDSGAFQVAHRLSVEAQVFNTHPLHEMLGVKA